MTMEMGEKRLIEDLIPVQAINAACIHEKTTRYGSPLMLHLWWARRPLAAARAAIYAALVPADSTPATARSADFFASLCQWGASDAVIAAARERVRAANGGSPPRVLDLFTGGGTIPLEALRLGCDATAVELNPVAHLIERCTLDYPQRFGPGLAEDLRRYGRRWLDSAWERVGHLYPRVREPQGDQLRLDQDAAADRMAGRPIAYLWTRTVPCPNAAGGTHELPLVRQTWLTRKSGCYTALKPHVDRHARLLEWMVVEAPDVAGLGFDPAGFSRRGRASCLICGAAVDAEYVKAQGRAGRMGIMPLAAVLVKPSGRGRDYLPPEAYSQPTLQDCDTVLQALGVEPPDEAVCTYMDAGFRVAPYGLTRFRDLFLPRQLAALGALSHGVREAHADARRRNGGATGGGGMRLFGSRGQPNRRQLQQSMSLHSPFRR